MAENKEQNTCIILKVNYEASRYLESKECKGYTSLKINKFHIRIKTVLKLSSSADKETAKKISYTKQMSHRVKITEELFLLRSMGNYIF